MASTRARGAGLRHVNAAVVGSEAPRGAVEMFYVQPADIRRHNLPDWMKGCNQATAEISHRAQPVSQTRRAHRSAPRTPRRWRSCAGAGWTR